MAQRRAAAGAPVECIDLVDSDDDVVQAPPARLPPPAAAVARLPDREVVTIDDSDDDEVPDTFQRRRKRRRHGKENAGQHNTVSLDDRKPAAAVDNRKPAAAVNNDAPQVVNVVRKQSPLENVLEVFPDVDHKYAQNLLQTQNGQIPVVLSILAEGRYPKQAGLTPLPNDGIILHCDKKKREFLHDYMSASSFEPSDAYTRQAQEKLQQVFPFLSVNGSRKMLQQQSKGHYAICHDAIVKAIMGGPLAKTEEEREEQYRLYKSAISGVPLSDKQHTTLMIGKRRMTVLTPRKKKKPLSITDTILLDEIAYVDKKMADFMEEVQSNLARKQNRAAAEKAGLTMECPCCCFDVAVDEMIACRQEGHLFCIDCLRRFAETQIFNLASFGVDKITKKPATDLQCMHSDGCSSRFDMDHLRKALPKRVMEKYEELQYKIAVDVAGIELFTCPECGIQAELPQSQMIFHCPEAHCGKETCRKCGEPAHIPLKCSEVEKKAETEGRLKVEEAISEAKIRTCPKPGCGKKFVKSDGCNKMTCACGTFMCYVCRAMIDKRVGYKHFCQKPHCQHQSCNGCPLYSNAEEDDKRAMREAGLQAAEEVRGDSLITDGDAQNGVEVRVDVDSLLKDVARPTHPVVQRRR